MDVKLYDSEKIYVYAYSGLAVAPRSRTPRRSAATENTLPK
jgi:hypothetical protein